MREGLQERQQVFGTARLHCKARRRPAETAERRGKRDLRKVCRMHQRDVWHRRAGGVCPRVYARSQDHHRNNEYGNRIRERNNIYEKGNHHHPRTNYDAF